MGKAQRQSAPRAMRRKQLEVGAAQHPLEDFVGRRPRRNDARACCSFALLVDALNRPSQAHLDLVPAATPTCSRSDAIAAEGRSRLESSTAQILSLICILCVACKRSDVWW